MRCLQAPAGQQLARAASRLLPWSWLAWREACRHRPQLWAAAPGCRRTPACLLAAHALPLSRHHPRPRPADGLELWSADGIRTVDSQSIFHGRFVKATPAEAEAALEAVRAALPLQKNREGAPTIA